MIGNRPKLLNFFQEINKKINNFRKLIIIFIFSLIFVTGMMSVKNYGTTNDEYTHRLNGFITLNYLGEKFLPDLTKKFRGDKEFPKYENMPDNLRYYGGTIIHTPLALMEIIFDIKDKKNIFLFKHYIFFTLFFLSLISFFNIIKSRFSDWKYAVLGVLILFISPRIFSNSIYNNLDIPFMAFVIFSLNSGLCLLKKTNFKNIILFSIFSAISIDIRIMGIMIPTIILSIFFFKSLILKKDYKKNFLVILYTTIITFFLVILTWPMLWSNPIQNLINVFKNLSSHPIVGYNFFLGEAIPSDQVPWHYLPVWILSTTPIIYSVFFFLGFYKFIKNGFQKKNVEFFIQDLSLVLVFFIPIVSVIFLNSAVYDGWRHVYFIYPSFVLLVLIGINWILKVLKNNNIYYLIQFIIIFSLFNTSYWMIKNHPHQYVFFNIFVRDKASEMFELDYLGASYKENLDYLVKTEKKDRYFIYNSSETKLWYPLFSLKDEDRLKFIETNKENAEYWITNYYFDKNIYNDDFSRKYEILNEIIIDGNKINSLLKLKK